MALQIWLPLTKDLRQQGLSDVTATNSGATYSATGGKLGGCYSFDGTDDRIWATGLNISGNVISVCCWFKRDSSYSNEGYIISLNNGGGYADCEIGIDTDSSHVIGVAGGVNCSYSCTHGTWHHIAVVYNKQNINTYLDGILLGTVSNTQSLIKPHFTVGARANGGNGGSGISYPFKGQITDVRLYDHCLSPMEVKKLSKGLVLHYPLNRQGWGQENLMPNSIEMPVGSANPSTGTWRLAGGSQMTRSRVSIPDAPSGASTYGFQSVGLQTGQDASCWGIDSFPKENGEVYTISAWGRIVGGSTTAAMLGFSLYNATTLDYGGTYGSALSSDAKYYGSGAYDYAGGQLNPNGNWTRIYRTFTSTSTSGNIYIGFNTAKTGSNVTLQLCGVKLEKGNKMTPWIPNSNESMYTTLDLNGTTEYDCSGFCNNGTRTGTFSWTSNTPKYAVSQVFNGTDNAIQTPSLPTMIADKNYTIAVWIYKTAIGSKNYQTIYGGPSGFELEARNGTTTEAKFVGWNWGKLLAAYEFNKWNHFCFVHSDSDCKIYLNGEYVSSGTAKASNPAGNYFIGAWNTATQQNYEGLMSDFRIYATALSASDVKSLYQNCATIDANGTIHGQIR